MEIPGFKNIIWDYTRKIAENINSIFGPISEQHGLTMMQTRILMELHHCGSHTIGSLGDSVCMAGANISAMCKKLESMGFLERVRNQADERVVIVALTKQGMDTVLEIDRTINEKISRHMTLETEEALGDIILGLQKLNNLLQSISKVESD